MSARSLSFAALVHLLICFHQVISSQFLQNFPPLDHWTPIVPRHGRHTFSTDGSGASTDFNKFTFPTDLKIISGQTRFQPFGQSGVSFPIKDVNLRLQNYERRLFDSSNTRNKPRNLMQPFASKLNGDEQGNQNGKKLLPSSSNFYFKVISRESPKTNNFSLFNTQRRPDLGPLRSSLTVYHGSVSNSEDFNYFSNPFLNKPVTLPMRENSESGSSQQYFSSNFRSEQNLKSREIPTATVLLQDENITNRQRISDTVHTNVTNDKNASNSLNIHRPSTKNVIGIQQVQQTDSSSPKFHFEIDDTFSSPSTKETTIVKLTGINIELPQQTRNLFSVFPQNNNINAQSSMTKNIPKDDSTSQSQQRFQATRLIPINHDKCWNPFHSWNCPKLSDHLPSRAKQSKQILFVNSTIEQPLRNKDNTEKILEQDKIQDEKCLHSFHTWLCPFTVKPELKHQMKTFESFNRLHRVPTFTAPLTTTEQPLVTTRRSATAFVALNSMAGNKRISINNAENSTDNKCSHPFHSWLCNKRVRNRLSFIPATLEAPKNTALPLIISNKIETSSVPFNQGKSFSDSSVEQTTTSSKPRYSTVNKCNHPFHSWLCLPPTTTIQPLSKPLAKSLDTQSHFVENEAPLPTSTQKATTIWNDTDPCTHAFHSWLCKPNHRKLTSPFAKPFLSSTVTTPAENSVFLLTTVRQSIPPAVSTSKPFTDQQRPAVNNGKSIDSPSSKAATSEQSDHSLEGKDSDPDPCKHSFHSYLCQQSFRTPNTVINRGKSIDPPANKTPVTRITNSTKKFKYVKCNHSFHSWLCDVANHMGRSNMLNSAEINAYIDSDRFLLQTTNLPNIRNLPLDTDGTSNSFYTTSFLNMNQLLVGDHPELEEVNIPLIYNQSYHLFQNNPTKFVEERSSSSSKSQTNQQSTSSLFLRSNKRNSFQESDFVKLPRSQREISTTNSHALSQERNRAIRNGSDQLNTIVDLSTQHNESRHITAYEENNTYSLVSTIHTGWQGGRTPSYLKLNITSPLLVGDVARHKNYGQSTSTYVNEDHAETKHDTEIKNSAPIKVRRNSFAGQLQQETDSNFKKSLVLSTNSQDDISSPQIKPLFVSTDRTATSTITLGSNPVLRNKPSLPIMSTGHLDDPLNYYDEQADFESKRIINSRSTELPSYLTPPLALKTDDLKVNMQRIDTPGESKLYFLVGSVLPSQYKPITKNNKPTLLKNLKFTTSGSKAEQLINGRFRQIRRNDQLHKTQINKKNQLFKNFKNIRQFKMKQLPVSSVQNNAEYSMEMLHTIPKFYRSVHLSKFASDEDLGWIKRKDNAGKTVYWSLRRVQ